MLKDLKILGKYNDSLYYLSLCIMIISFPFSVAINSISLGLILLFFLLDHKNLKTNFPFYLFNRRNILLVLLFSSLSFSLIYSANFSKGLDKITGYFIMIGIPLMMTKAQTLSQEQVRRLRKLHIAVCVLASLVCLALATVESGLLDGSYKNKVAPHLYVAYFVHRFTYHELSEQINSHAIYFSFFIAVALVFVAYEMRSARRNKQIVLFFVSAFLSVILFLLKSVMINFAYYSFLLFYLFSSLSFKRMTQHLLFYLLSLFAASIIFYLFILKDIGSFAQNTYLFEDPALNRKFIIILIGALGMAILAVFLKRKFIRSHFAVSFILITILGTFLLIGACRKNLERNDGGKEKNVTNVSARTGSWAGAWLIIKEHPLSGIGIGDTEAALIEKYKEINFETGVVEKFNVHNQYIEFWVNSGIIAVLCFALLLISESYYAYINRNFVLLGLLYLFALFCLTESVMNRQVGRVFFLFFLCLLSSDHRTHVMVIKNQSI